jgi:UDP-N-acetylmuramyl pentapeptide synthase
LALNPDIITDMKKVLKKIIRAISLRATYALARGYRRTICKTFKTRFIGITGSCGKTTTTELIAAILSSQGQIIKNSFKNTDETIAKTILAVRSKHLFCVQEAGAGAPGLLAKSVKLIMPHISVVTNIGQDHYALYRTPQATANDKVKIIEALPDDGIAVLNADDALVLEMRNHTKARVITFGLSADAMVRGQNVSSAWPQRLSLDVRIEGKQAHIQTQLLGEHWACAVLAAVATGIAAGVPFENIVKAVETVAPTPRRMCPHQAACGATIISDNWKGALWTVPFSFDFMKKAKAQRKIAIIGTLADTPRSFFDRYKHVIRLSDAIVEKIIFVGEHALTALRVHPNRDNQDIMAFSTLSQLDTFLNGFLKPGDLVLIKGVENIDHLQRIILTQTGKIKHENICWQKDCRRKRACEDCKHLRNLTP